MCDYLLLRFALASLTVAASSLVVFMLAVSAFGGILFSLFASAGGFNITRLGPLGFAIISGYVIIYKRGRIGGSQLLN